MDANRWRRRQRQLGALVALLVLSLLLGGTALAGKPEKKPKPDPDPDPPALSGTIYLAEGNELHATWPFASATSLYGLDLDGAGTPVDLQRPGGFVSHAEHGGSPWVLHGVETSGSHPDGFKKMELHATNIATGSTVALLTQSDFDAAATTEFEITYDAWVAWWPGDTSIALTLVVWDLSSTPATIQESGIYVADVSWDTATGTPSLDPSSWALLAAVPAHDSSQLSWQMGQLGIPTTALMFNGGAKFYVDPDGELLLYDDKWELPPKILDLLTSSSTPFSPSCAPNPAPGPWSPDGTSIVFIHDFHVYLTDAAQYSCDLLADSGDKRNNFAGFYVPLVWSPQGTHVAVRHRVVERDYVTHRNYVIDVATGTDTSLTPDAGCDYVDESDLLFLHPIAWRP